MARGLASRDSARRSGVYFAFEAVHAELGQMLSKARVKARHQLEDDYH